MVKFNSTIFRTITDEATGATKSIGLFGKSFAELKDISNSVKTNGIFKTSTLSEPDIKIIEKYNDLVKVGITDQTELEKVTKGASAATAQMIKNANGNAIALDKMTIGAKAASVAMKGLAMVGNIALGMAISWGITKAIEGISKVINHEEEAIEASNKARKDLVQQLEEQIQTKEEEISTLEEEIDSLNDLQDKLDEVKNNKKGLLALEKEIYEQTGYNIDRLSSTSDAYNEVTLKVQAQIAEKEKLLAIDRKIATQQKRTKIRENTITNEGGEDVTYADLLDTKLIRGDGTEVSFEEWAKKTLGGYKIQGKDITNPTVIAEAIRDAEEYFRNQADNFQQDYLGHTKQTIDDYMENTVISEQFTEDELKNFDSQKYAASVIESVKNQGEDINLENIYRKLFSSFEDDFGVTLVTENFIDEEINRLSNVPVPEKQNEWKYKNGNKFKYKALPNEAELTEYFSQQFDDIYDTFDYYIHSNKDLFVDETIKDIIATLYGTGSSLEEIEAVLEKLSNEGLTKNIDDLWLKLSKETDEKKINSIVSEIDQKVADYLSEAGIDKDDPLFKSLIDNYFSSHLETYKFKNAEEVIASVSDVVNKIKEDLSSELNELGNFYKEVFTEDGFVFDSNVNELLSGLQEQLKGVEGFDMKHFETFAQILQDPETDTEKAQTAFNDLASAIFYNSETLDLLNETTADGMILQLRSLGITNAKTLVTKALNGELDALNLATKYGYENAEELASKIWDDTSALEEFKNASEACRKYLGELRLEEIKFNEEDLSVQQRIDDLKKLATAYGFTTNAKEIWQQQAIEGTGGSVSNIIDWDKTWENYLAEFEKQWDAEFGSKPEFKDPDPGSGKDSTKETEANFDWIETKIEHLSSKAEKEAKKATDSIFAYISKKYKKSHLNSAISISQEAISATREGKAYYEKERDKIGLPKEWADKVKYGAIDIDSDELKGKDELIKKIEEYQELTDKINNCTTTIEDLVSNIQEYAEQLANLPIEEAEKKIEKLTSKTDVLSAQYDNLNTYKAKNKNLDEQHINAQAETKARKTAMNEANKYLKSTWKAEGMSIALSKSANKGKKFGDELSTDGLEVGSVAYNAVLKYNEALKVSTDAQNEYSLAVENETKILHDNTKAKYDNVSAYRSSLRSVREAQVSKAQAKIDYRNAKGLNNNTKEGKKVYQDMLKGQQAILTNYREERKKYDQDTLDKQYKSGELSFEEYKQLTAYISQLDEEILKSQADVLETQKILNEFKLTSLGNQIADAQRSSDKLGNELALKEKRWGEKAITKTDYNDQLSANKKLIGNYKDQNAELTKLRNKTEKYSDQWFEYQEQIDANNSSIQDLRLSNEDLKDSIRKLDYRPYENIREEVDKTVTTIEALIGLINDDSLFDDEGALTKLGTAKFSILGKELAETKESVASYVDQIEEINKKYKEYQKDKNNGYSVAEYEEEMNEATTGLYDLLSKSKSVTDAIIAMHTQQQQVIIDALKEEISARNEALQKKKEYYDYDKQIRTKTKDIQALEAQKAALEVTEDSLEKRRKLVELEAELTKQREELEETQKDHEINLVVNGLNEFTEDVQERFDDYVKKLSGSFEDQIEIIQNATTMYKNGFTTIAQTFNDILSFYGVDTKNFDVSKLGIPGYATGGVVGGTSYRGDKLIARVNSGESILTQDFTELLPHAVNVMQDLTKATAPNLNHLVKVQPAINVSYDNLINIEGNATNETIVELKKLMPSITKQVTKSIKDDMKKSGY